MIIKVIERSKEKNTTNWWFNSYVIYLSILFFNLLDFVIVDELKYDFNLPLYYNYKFNFF